MKKVETEAQTHKTQKRPTQWEARAPPPRTPAVSGALQTKGETGGQGENTRSS